MEQGKCPKCRSEMLSYETIVDSTPESQTIYYPYTCDDCGFSGRECYNIHFTGHTDNSGVIVE